MKRIYAFLFMILFLCGAAAPAALAADTTASSSGSGTSSADAGRIVLTQFDEPGRTDAVAFALGTSTQEISDWFSSYNSGFTGYDAQGNPYDLMAGTWSLNMVDTGTPGVYNAFTTPDLGDTYILADGVSLPRQLCAISIQTPGKPDINCCVSARGFLHFPWILSPEQQNQLGQFTVFLRQDGGEWTQLNDGFCCTSEDLQLSQRVLAYASTYELKVTYPGGQTGVLTFQYDGELSILDYSGGDRDGGDVNGSGPLIGSQASPSSTQAPGSSENDSNHNNESSTAIPSTSSSASSEAAAEPQGTSLYQGYTQAVQHNVQKAENIQSKSNTEYPASSAAVQESYSPTQTVISGLRLRGLCADGESVVFGEGNLTVSIPGRWLLALNLADTDTLSVTLTQPESRRIMLAVNVSGRSAAELPGTVLRLRYKPQEENAVITVQDEGGNPLTDAAFDGEFLRFTANAAGTYAISEVPAIPQKTQGTQGSAALLFLFIGGAFLLAAAGGLLIWRKRHG